MRISDWSSDVCSADLPVGRCRARALRCRAVLHGAGRSLLPRRAPGSLLPRMMGPCTTLYRLRATAGFDRVVTSGSRGANLDLRRPPGGRTTVFGRTGLRPRLLCTPGGRSEEHTSELQSLMRTSSAVF